MYQVQAQDGTQYALKKMNIQEESSLIQARKEVEIWKKLMGSSMIVQYVDSQLVTTASSKKEMLILCELCEGGFTLVDMIKTCNFKI